MKKGLLCLLASLLLGSCLATFAGGAIPLPPPFFSDHIRIVGSGALSIEPETEILHGVVDRNDKLKYGLHDDDVQVNYALGLGLWLPMVTWADAQLNAVTWFNVMPNDDETAVSKFANRGWDRRKDDDFFHDGVLIKTRRLNWGLGVNYLMAFDQDYFMLMMVGVGLSFFHAKAEFINEIDEADDSGADHPGMDSARVFVMGQLGIGKKLSEKSSVILFADGAWAARDDHYFLIPNNEDDAGLVNIEPSNWWVLVGVKFTRAIVL